MERKILAALFLVMLAIPTMASTITVSYNTPSSGVTYNNLAANIRDVDINLAITDDNADTFTVGDINLIVDWVDAATWTRTSIIDANLRDLEINPTSQAACSIGVSLTTMTCSIRFTLPDQATASDNTYYFDANVVDYFRDAGAEDPQNGDTNAILRWVINTHIPTAQATRDLMASVGMILAAIVLIGGLFSIGVLKTDLVKTSIITIIAAIFVAIGAMVIGIVLATL